ncbi:MAG: hypothetical protein P4M11_06760 [Candidatus Pacebacteria bacterium]|nr:hypothetical protein [Candidatus Paceibacterota bacterium]
MGCGVNPKVAAAMTPTNLELSLAMNLQLDKWNSRQIMLVRARFKLGLSKQSQFALDFPGFCAVFPLLTRLPHVRRFAEILP